jgi:lipopolysaccharide biosynthesis regulator YciM
LSPLFVAGLLAVAALVILLLISRRMHLSRSETAPENHHLNAMEALADDDSGRALQELQAAVKLGQGGVDSYLRLADIYRDKGLIKKAIHLHRSLDVNRSWSKQVRARIQRGLAADYLAGTRWEEAMKHLEELRKLTPSDPWVFRGISQVHLHRGEGDRAQAALKRAHRLEGTARPDELALLRAEQGRRLMAEQRWKESRKALHEAGRLNPECVSTLRLSSDLFMHEGKEQQAADEMQKLVLSGQEGSEEYYSKMEKLFFELGRFQEIQFVYQELITRHPELWEPRFALATILEKRGRRDEALRLLDPSLEASDIIAGRAAARLLEWDDPQGAARWLDRFTRENTTATIWRCSKCGAEHPRLRWYCLTCHSFKSYHAVREEIKTATAHP